MQLSVFDLDGTLIRGNSSFRFCFYLIQKRVLPRSAMVYAAWNYLCHSYGNRSLVDLHKKVFDKLLKGIKVSSLEEHVEPFLQTLFAKFCYGPAIESLRCAQHLGHYTLILSNAPSFLVKSVAKYFKVDGWHATEYAVDNDNKLCHISSIMQGEDKAACVTALTEERGWDMAAVTAYSDSHLDLPLLKAAGVAVAVNPDSALRKVSKRLNWKIL